jgi:hypothetical protein
MKTSPAGRHHSTVKVHWTRRPDNHYSYSVSIPVGHKALLHVSASCKAIWINSETVNRESLHSQAEILLVNQALSQYWRIINDVTLLRAVARAEQYHFDVLYDLCSTAYS